jgi:hypothetical protein
MPFYFYMGTVALKHGHHLYLVEPLETTNQILHPLRSSASTSADYYHPPKIRKKQTTYIYLF